MDALCNIGQTERSVLNYGTIFCTAYQHHIKSFTSIHTLPAVQPNPSFQCTSTQHNYQKTYTYFLNSLSETGLNAPELHTLDLIPQRRQIAICPDIKRCDHSFWANLNVVK